ncbi:MAG: MFS transporter, partial [Chloroflexi bacterium]|nr:MFS transporter [Chloroflexota bacterium]
TLAYSITTVGLMLSFGKAGDKLGRKPIYTTGVLIFTIGLVLNSIAPNIITLISFRVIQAVGAAMMMAVGPAIITSVFPGQERGKALGIYGGVIGAGLAFGPAFGGLFLDLLGWRSIFYLRIPISFIVFIMSLTILKKGITGEGKYNIDLWGSLTLFISMGSLLFGVNQAGHYGWGSLIVILPLLISLILMIMFLIIEKKVKDPLLNLNLFKNIPFTNANISLFITFVVRMVSAFLMPFFLLQAAGYPSYKAGIILITVPVSMLIVSPFAGWISDRIGSRLLCAIGAALMGGSLFLFSSMDSNVATYEVVLKLIVMGVGQGVFEAPVNSTILGSVSKENLGTASAILNTVRGIGFAMGLAITSAIYTASQTSHYNSLIQQGFVPELAKKTSIVNGFHDALIIGTFIGIAATLYCLLSIKQRKEM